MTEKLVYIGRSAGIYYGKTLYEILRQLKNFGAGRMVIRESFSNRYPEPCYYIIRKAEPDMNDSTMKHGEISATKVFRGVRYPESVAIHSAYKPDWALVSKHEEQKYLNYDGPKRNINVIKRTKPYPPLLEKFLMKEQNLTEPPLMEIEPKVSPWNVAAREDKLQDPDVLKNFSYGGVNFEQKSSPST